VIAAGIVLASLLAALWLSLRDESPSSSPATHSVPRSSFQPEPSRSADVQPPAPASAGAAEMSTRASVASAPTAVASAAPSAPRTHVFGRLVGEDGAPIAGASLWLDCDGEWAAGVKMPSVDIRGHRTSAFESKSDAEGRFDFDVPVPTSSEVLFFFEPDEFHSIDSREFGPDAGHQQPPLKAGDNDLGAFRLTWTGSIEGTVRAGDGSAIAKAQVSIHGASQCRSESDGKFLLEHVPAGSWSLEVKRDGFMSLEKSVAIEARHRTSGTSIVLERAPSISGMVVDESGAPLAGIQVQGWPAESGQGAHCQTAADGTFTMALPRNGEYRFDIQAPGYEHFGGFASTAYAPGTRDVRIVLEKSHDVDVSIVDAETGAAVESFGIALTVVEADGWHTDESLEVPKVTERANGRATVPLERGKVIARVFAPGYASVSVPLEVSAGAREAPPIRLVKAASIRGRVVRAGAPRTSARVELASAWSKRDVSQPDEPEEERIFSDNYARDVAGFAGRKRDATVDAEGRFHFDDLGAGRYRLVVRDSDDAPYVVESIAVAAKQALDLGDIALRAGGSIRGRIVPQPTLTIGKWEVTLDRPYAPEHAEVDTSGLFRFDGIEPGKHVLVVKCESSDDEPKPLLEIDVAAGETREVVLDVGALVPARVTVRVTRGGLPVQGVQVIGSCEATRQESRIGDATDLHGVATGNCTPCDAVRFNVLSELQLPLGEATTAIRVPAGESIDVSVSVNAGRARVEFPAGFVVPPRARAVVIVGVPGSPEQSRVVTCSTPDCPMMFGASWKESAIDLGELRAGEYELSVDVAQASEAKGASIEFRNLAPAYRGKLVVKTDASAVCTLAPYEPPK
jgi:hypothetical protein